MSKCGIRIDSGDLAYLTKRARTMLDEAGLTEVKISASGDLDENLISSLKDQGAQIDAWGGGIFNFAVQAAHDTRQRNGLGAVADDEVVGRQGEFFFVQRCDLLAVFGAADEDLAAFQRVHVEGVHGLANPDCLHASYLARS